MSAPQARTPVRKPAWLDAATFDKLIANCGGVPRCAVTGETENLTVDHIVARYNGGTKDISNLQFLVDRINAKKGIRPDPHWSKTFYWDREPDLNAFRAAQRDLYMSIVADNWFRRPVGEIAQQLYLNAWVVGAGKTLGIAAAAWAVNRVIRDQWGDAPRADRILVVTKEQAVRDQLAADLKKDLVGYGIVTRPPRVAVVRDGDTFTQTGWLDNHDIVVTCGQMLWERKGNTEAVNTKVAEILAGFRVIAFDEPHFAADQVHRLVGLATQSLCFGFTGTPIDGAGELLDRIVALSIYDYDAAVTNDGGLRWLDSHPSLFRTFVNELGIHGADLIEHGERGRTEDATKDGYDKNVEPAKSVMQAVIEETLRRDQLVVAAEKLAPHRAGGDVVMGVLYPAHPMIVCDSVPAAQMLCDAANDLFEKERDTYPLWYGWRAEVVYAEGEGRRAKPLTNNHAWMRARNQDWLVDGKCARLLFVVGMAREGVNNPACGPIGVACAQTSIVEWVQRGIGRQLRAVTKRCPDGALAVPPAPLDQPLIITHATYDNGDTIRRALDFVCDMSSYLSGLPTIADLDGRNPPQRDTRDRDYLLPRKTKIAIAGRLGEFLNDGQEPPIDDVVIECLGTLSSGERGERAREWAHKVWKEPGAARREIRLRTDLTPRLIVTREQVKLNPTDEDLERHLQIHEPHLVAGYLPIKNEFRPLIVAHYLQHSRQFFLPPLTSKVTIDDLRKGIARSVKDQLGRHFVGDDRIIYKLVGSAVKLTLGAKGSVNNGSDWDVPQVHAMLRRADVQSDILGWVIDRLINKGCCPALEILRNTGGADDAA